MNAFYFYGISFLILIVNVISISNDKNAMKNLARAIGNSKPDNWFINGSNYCSWTGISCNSYGRVNKIELPSSSLVGTLPSQLRDLSELQILSVSNNFLSGNLPSFANMSSLEVVCLESNFFDYMPLEFFLGLKNLKFFSISQNHMLSPWLLPVHLRDSLNLLSFAASNANLMGTIPDIFGGAVRYIRLSHNNLTGLIPDSLTSLSKLETFDVSFNNLTGLIPVFPSSVNFTCTGNTFLEQNTSGISIGNPHKSSSASLIAGTVIGVLVLIVGVLYLYYRYYTNKHRNYRMPLMSIQVLRQATDNFHNDNILGTGGFGTVYKGQLQNGTIIAVKRMGCTNATQEFQREVDILTAYRHKNLLSLLGYCIHTTERCLVYEYMGQGNLSQRLFDCEQYGYTRLTWEQRVRIAFDVAQGVCYLHDGAQSGRCIIHRDLKSANILLGDDMRAKVADFGLVRETSIGQTHTMSQLIGTLGYIAPESANGEVSAKSDVYSYGVILMELITGTRAYEVGRDEADQLVPWFRRQIIQRDDNSAIINIVRDRVVYVTEQTLAVADDQVYDSICLVAELAAQCTARYESQRPDMRTVAAKLSSLAEPWTPSLPEQGVGPNVDSLWKTLELDVESGEGTSVELY